MYDKEINQIIDASKNNALTIFVGAGISAISGAPTWSKLLDAICIELGMVPPESYSSDDFLRLPQVLFYSLNEDEKSYLNFVKKHVVVDGLIPNQFHKELLNLNPSSFITTNYDTLLEDAAMQNCQGFKVVSKDSEIPSIYGDRYILKLHGDFKNNNIVLKEEDYLNYSENFKLMETFMKSVFSTNTVVFIGYSLNDYNIKLILNWTKSMLKSSFRRPIFVYTGENPLSPEEKLYQESKGLTVIDCMQLNPDDSTYSSQYSAFFKLVKSYSTTSLSQMTEEQAFSLLYKLLLPLNSLNALRISDVTKKLYPYIVSVGDGTIRVLKENALIMQKFVSIHKMSSKKRNTLSRSVRKKYEAILMVLKKARIGLIEILDGNRCTIRSNLPFADRLCIMYDYSAMNAFVSKKRLSLYERYKKAFYLSRLKRYDEAFFLCSEVASQAFKQKDYLLYYLAKSNCISLEKIIKNINRWYQCYDMTAVDLLTPSETETDNLFLRLPAAFRNDYNTLNDLFSPNMLYKYSYEAFTDGQKLRTAIEKNTTEFGLTSGGKAVIRINDYINFLLGNCIIADEFSEYRNTIKNLMSLLVYKYATQEKTVLGNNPFSDFAGPKIYFDEVDFYCFIKCFTDKEIVSLFKQYNIETIAFEHMTEVEQIVCNMMDYYDNVISDSSRVYEALSLQGEIKVCISILRYVDISQETVDRICDFILKHSFRDIMIDDKVFFLDAQLYHRKKTSEKTEAVVQEVFISYLDKHIECLRENKQFELASSCGASYFKLVHYIHPGRRAPSIGPLSRRISKIVKYNLIVMVRPVYREYWRYISRYQKKRFIAWIRELIDKQFRFDLLTALVVCGAEIEENEIKLLKEYLLNRLKSRDDMDARGAKILSAADPDEDFKQVGYWCMIHVLKHEDFKEFVGINNAFDFYYLYNKYDFRKFEVSFLLDRNKNALQLIAKNREVRAKIRKSLAQEIKMHRVSERDEKELQRILIEYFC